MKFYISSAASMIPRSLNWVYQYYDVVSSYELKNMLGIPNNSHLEIVEDMKNSYPGYKTICHLVAKDEFVDFLTQRACDAVDVIKEPAGGPYFLGQIIGDRIYDVTQTAEDACQECENYIMQMY